MTEDAFRDLCRETSVGRFPIPIAIVVAHCKAGGVARVTFIMTVPHVVGGNMISVTQPMDFYFGARRARVVEKLRAAMRRMVVHELDEHFTVAGVRVYDPHAPDD